MAWYFRVIEVAEGWTCHFGEREFDIHDQLELAVDHIRLLAVDHQPAELYIHHRDGSIESHGTVQPGMAITARLQTHLPISGALRPPGREG